MVIPVHDHGALLPNMLSALAGQQGVVAGTWEVVLVDNGSSDRVADHIRDAESPFPITLVEQHHTGKAWARNVGWKRSSARVIAFLDDDLIPDSTFVARHIEAHAGRSRAVVLGLVASEPGRSREAWTAYDNAKLRAKYQGFGEHERPSGIHIGGNFSLSHSLLEQVGGFDSRLPSSDHVDLGFRLRALGVRFIYEPKARVVRHGRIDYESWQLSHRLHGRLDVAVFRDREYAGGLKSLVACYHDRHSLNRLAVRLALTNRVAERLVLSYATRVGTAGHRLKLRPLSTASMSIAANVLYWGGVRDGLRGNDSFWRLVRSTRKYKGRPYELPVGVQA